MGFLLCVRGAGAVRPYSWLPLASRGVSPERRRACLRLAFRRSFGAPRGLRPGVGARPCRRRRVLASKLGLPSSCRSAGLQAPRHRLRLPTWCGLPLPRPSWLCSTWFLRTGGAPFSGSLLKTGLTLFVLFLRGPVLFLPSLFSHGSGGWVRKRGEAGGLDLVIVRALEPKMAASADSYLMFLIGSRSASFTTSSTHGLGYPCQLPRPLVSAHLDVRPYWSLRPEFLRPCS